MPLIYNKPVKKLFAFLFTFSTVTGHPDFGLDNLKTPGFRDIPLYVTRYWVVKFKNPAAAKTYQVVMLSGLLCLIMVVVFIKMNLLHQTQFLELLQSPIYSGQTEARLPPSGQAIKLISVKVTFPLANNIQEQRPLIGNPQSGGT